MEITIQHFSSGNAILNGPSEIGHMNITLSRIGIDGEMQSITIGSNVDHSFSQSIADAYEIDPSSLSIWETFLHESGDYYIHETLTASFTSQGGVLQVEPIDTFAIDYPRASKTVEVSSEFAEEFNETFDYFTSIAASGQIPSDWDLFGFHQDGLNCAEFVANISQSIGISVLDHFSYDNLVSSIAGDQLFQNAVQQTMLDEGLGLTEIGLYSNAIEDTVRLISRGRQTGVVTETELEALIHEHKTLMGIGVRLGDLRSTMFQYAIENDLVGECFLAATPISLPDGSARPIERIRPGDEVLSYDATGALVPARVTRTFQKQAKHILDFHGTMVTPGHVYYCSEGRFAGQHVPLLDILRSDGGIQTQEGVNLRASTQAEIGSPLDQMIAVVAGERTGDGQAQVVEEGQIRLGTRYILEDGHDISIAELIAAAGGRVTKDGLIAQVGAEPAPFHWPFSARLPKPEDYVLQRSALTLNEIYQVSEWEQQPRMPTPVMGDLGPVEPVGETVLQAMPPNVPPALEGGDRAPRMTAAQTRAHHAKRRRKARDSGSATRH